jgi:nitrogen fixation/metabolism regulation signal transduction histidine kinase
MRGTSSLRQRILLFVGALVLLSLLGSVISLYRITEVNQGLDAINRVSVPLGRLFAQMQSDADVYRREADRRLGYAHWSDPHWQPKPVPKWIEDLMSSELDRTRELVAKDAPWAPDEAKNRLREWVGELAATFATIRHDTDRLYLSLSQKDDLTARTLYPVWNERLEQWARQIQWGTSEYDRTLRQGFALAQQKASDLRTGLEIILIVVISMSLMILWVGERALRPLSELTALARGIARRGIRREDKAALPEIPLNRNDEVTQLAREFHAMATALLEREKMVETQTHRLLESNRLLREMGGLNENILKSIESVLIVADLTGTITQCNPVAASWLGARVDQVLGSTLSQWKELQAFPELAPALGRVLAESQVQRIDSCRVGERYYGGHLMPLRQDEAPGAQASQGAILVLHDLTDELELQARLRQAEHLAAVGRMSAQVAHEVRNPLHSIGLEAEMACELAARHGDIALKQSLQSILGSVDRLEKITENYLKLSRMTEGRRDAVDLAEVLEGALATYVQACEAQRVRVDWGREPGSHSSLRVVGDRDLLEQALGNLIRNSLQALELHAAPGSGRISCRLGLAESGRVWLRVEDNGPGVSAEVRSRLFTPFVTSRAQGTGLGLSFVKKVIEEHGGQIEYRERPEGGAAFEIVLPQHRAERHQPGSTLHA